MIVRTLLLTGQRRNEIASLAWPMIDQTQRVITFPAFLTKNKREHSIPFGDMMAVSLDAVANRNGLLFPARGIDAPFNGWSKAKREFDASCGITNWTLHDLRRTYSTNLSKLGVAPHVTERLLNHVTGQISGVAAIYNRWSYLPEMKDAVRKCEIYLGELTA